MADYSVVGTSVNRKDANQKVKGRVTHVGNIQMPGMLHVAVLRSPHAHARITRLHKTGAESMPGVAAVMTGKARGRPVSWTGLHRPADSRHRPGAPRG